MPDWLAGIWKKDLPQLGGKLKLDAPARVGTRRPTDQRQGRDDGGHPQVEPRTSKPPGTSPNTLYLSPDLAEQSFR